VSYAFDSRLGKQLYQLLPEVYRSRDKVVDNVGGGSGNEDLAKYLDAHGHLLDLIHATLEQRLKDTLPESSQDWLLPYFAQLLAANIVSPDSEGKHAEVAHAVSWRQRKGTLKCAEEIAEAVGQMEVEIQEGWKRVAVTPKVGMPLVPVKAIDSSLNLGVWGDALEYKNAIPSQAARHPSLPAVMVDLCRASRAVASDPANPASKNSSFAGVRKNWRQANRHAAPSFPGSFDDVSRRTVDLRSTSSAKAHVHPKQLLLFTPPQAGMFLHAPIRLKWSERHDAMFDHLIGEQEEGGMLRIFNKTERVIHIVEAVILAAGNYRIEGLNFLDRVQLSSGTLELEQVEAIEMQVDSSSSDAPVLVAEQCLFNELSVGSGSARLDSCTVLKKAYLYDIDAVNCIFMDMTGASITGVVQYSRIPPVDQALLSIEDCTSEVPAFFASEIALGSDGKRVFDGAGVLRADCASSIYAGADDAGEMGYYHRGRATQAVRIDSDHMLNIPAVGAYKLEDLIFSGAINTAGGALELQRCAVATFSSSLAVIKDEDGYFLPSVNAIDCLFDHLDVPNGLVRLEYCSVMTGLNCKHLQASDSVFIGSMSGISKPNVSLGEQAKFSNCVRFSSLPATLDIHTRQLLNLRDGAMSTNSWDKPLFYKFYFCTETANEHRYPNFGEPGYGVLHSLSSSAIRFGAEDGGEMGACHHQFLSLKVEAVLSKLHEFLPLGIEPVLIHDERLLHVPPENKSSS